jgi:hypothetical protein
VPACPSGVAGIELHRIELHRQNRRRKKMIFSYYANMWALGVIGMVRNQLYQTFFRSQIHGGAVWICSSKSIFSKLELCQTRSKQT